MNLKIKVVEKWKIDEFSNKIGTYWGIEIYDLDSDYFYRPIYPFSNNPSSDVLEEFVETYEKDLLDFYVNGWNYSFATSDDRESDIGTGIPEKFRDYWHSRGVVIF
ncbi:hypothetical protein [Streptococcus equinus]|uniref:hypothetical protein n=1 Tax=Streptococcus equinus TaxID=1335 RepID=UPI0008D27A4F|nr:hypothetical protein [Streptococcus equinus]SEP72098.1 hypothetical protein SAMN05216346_101572 [Streptococcus equinus]SFR66751.1 hypothetical protein SAMN05216416_0727 [Streptococcus equinus]